MPREREDEFGVSSISWPQNLPEALIIQHLKCIPPLALIPPGSGENVKEMEGRDLQRVAQVARNLGEAKPTRGLAAAK